MFLRWSQRTRDGRALLLAGVLHAASLLGLWAWVIHQPRMHPQVELPASADRQELIEDEVEVQVDGPRPSPAERRVAGVPPSDSAPRRAGHAGGVPPPLAGDGAPLTPVARAESDPALPPQAPLPAARAVDLGLGAGDWRRWLSETKAELPAAPRAHPASRALFRAPPVSTTGGLQEGLEAHDRALGLGTSGPVISALYHAAHGDVAPFEGSARFLITVLKTGEVEVALSDATSDLEGWRVVAAHAAEALRRAPPRIPSVRKGARLVVEITAKQTFPNGVQPKERYDLRGQVELVRLRSVQSAQRELADRNPVSTQPAAPGETATGSKANANLPGVYVGARGKVCTYRQGLALGLGQTLPLLGPLLDGGCDPSNLGAKPQRLVSTRVREETLY